MITRITIKAPASSSFLNAIRSFWKEDANGAIQRSLLNMKIALFTFEIALLVEFAYLLVDQIEACIPPFQSSVHVILQQHRWIIYRKEGFLQHLIIKIKKDFKEDVEHERVVRDQYKIYNSVVIISITIL